jgi:hypothetical protein
MFARNLVPLFALALSGALALADGDGTEPGAPGEESPAAEPIAAPSAEQEVAVPLELGTPGRDGTRIGYSSARRVEAETTVPRFLFDTPKFRAKDPIFFRLGLGETKGIPFYGALDRSPEGMYHDRLYLDVNRDLDLTNDGAPIEARVRTLWTNDGRLVEFLAINLTLPYVIEGKESTPPYLCVVYYALEKGKDTPDWLAVERDGWREGAVTIGGEEYVLAILDDDSDGQFTTGDAWVMRKKGEETATCLARSKSRRWHCSIGWVKSRPVFMAPASIRFICTNWVGSIRLLTLSAC